MVGLRPPESRVLIIKGVDKFPPMDMESFQLPHGMSQVLHDIGTELLQDYHRYDDGVFVEVEQGQLPGLVAIPVVIKDSITIPVNDFWEIKVLFWDGDSL